MGAHRRKKELALNPFSLLQGYELADSEVKVGLDRFRRDFTNDDGSPKYVKTTRLSHQIRFSPLLLTYPCQPHQAAILRAPI